MDTVEFLNSVEVTKDELWDLAEEAESLVGTDSPSEAGMYLIARRCKGQPRKASAIWFRMQALTDFIETEQSHGWTLPQEKDGSIPTMEPVFAAAAVHPLTSINSRIRFEPVSFSKRVLELAEAEGRS